VDRHTRKNLKTDKFALEVTHGFEWITEHKTIAIRYGSIAAAVIVVVLGVYLYIRHQATAREDALAAAIKIDNASVGQPNPQAPAGALNYPTLDAKETARIKAFSDLAAKYPGTQEGSIAEMYLASDAGDKGNTAEAEKRYKNVMDTGPTPYASLARLALAQVYQGEGKTADAEKLLREAINHPTITVSKEDATIQLALLLAKTNPEEARKMLEPLRTSPRTPVSRAAVEALGQVLLPGK
jgi:predicted negative regulator of RcsB-dependent stress response